jgi:ornithine carbamoyltransferase
MPTHLRTLLDWKKDDIKAVVTDAIKNKGEISDALSQKTLVMFFEKPSTRTRLSFEVGMTQLGGHGIYFDLQSSQISRGESVRDVAEVISRYGSALMARVKKQETIDELCRHSKIPIINGLSDIYHPCQGLTDIMTVLEHKKEAKKITFVGDGDNNVTYSLILAASAFDIPVTVGCPKKYNFNEKVISESKFDLLFDVTDDPVEAADGADAIYTDTWVSMGRSDVDERKNALKPFQVNPELVKNAKPDYLFMHCLPQHIGDEVTEEVAYSRNSVIFPQAENRMHLQKELLKKLILSG